MDVADVLSHVDRLYSNLERRRPEIEEFGDYYDGKQPLVFASREWSEFHKDRYKGFADNWCAVVADTPAERLRPVGIVGHELGDLGNEYWNIWQRNDGEILSAQGFLDALIARRSFVTVWYDNDDEPTMDWETADQAYVEYYPGSRTRRRFAIKAWIDDDGWEFLNFFTEKQLWKFKRRTDGVRVTNGVTDGGIHVVGTSYRFANGLGGWVPRDVGETGDDSWPLDHNIGAVPVVEIGNRSRLGKDPISEIAGTKAMQDAINLLWAYLFGSADHASFPARVVMGTEQPKMPVLDENGQVVGSREVAIKDLQNGRLLWLTGQNAKIGQWDSAKLDVFTEVIDKAVGHVAAQTRTPSHYLMTQGDNIPAQGYELSEAGLVRKVKLQSLFFGSDMREVLRLFALVKGDAAGALAMKQATVLFEDPATRVESQIGDAIVKRAQAGYPLEELLIMDGKSPDDIQRIMEAVARQREREVDPTIARVMREVDEYAEGPALG